MILYEIFLLFCTYFHKNPQTRLLFDTMHGTTICTHYLRIIDYIWVLTTLCFCAFGASNFSLQNGRSLYSFLYSSWIISSG